MPRPIWTGSISFGLVNVPVKLFSATQDKDVRFHQFERGTGERIRLKRVAENSGQEVPFENIDKGYELSKGEYVIVTPDELDSVAPGQTRAIDIEDFIELSDVDPVYFQTTYIVAPTDDAAARPYRVLQEAMERSGRAAIARFVMRSKQHLAAIRSANGRLMLETMYFADEVRSVNDIRELEKLSSAAAPTDREINMAEQLLDSLTTEWQPEKYKDNYRAEVMELIESKAKGEAVVTEKGPEPAPVIDLMAALEASVQRAREGRGAAPDNAGVDYEAMSREELYEKAQEHNIAGRSKMSKEELIEALKAVDSRKDRRKAS